MLESTVKDLIEQTQTLSLWSLREGSADCGFCRLPGYSLGENSLDTPAVGWAGPAHGRENHHTLTQPQHACRVKEAITQSCKVFSSVSTIPLSIPLKTSSSFPSQSKV